MSGKGPESKDPHPRPSCRRAHRTWIEAASRPPRSMYRPEPVTLHRGARCVRKLFRVVLSLILVKVSDEDWRIVYDQEPWPKASFDAAKSLGAGVAAEAEKAANELETLCKGIQEDKFTKAEVEQNLPRIRETIKLSFKKL